MIVSGVAGRAVYGICALVAVVLARLACERHCVTVETWRTDVVADARGNHQEWSEVLAPQLFDDEIDEFEEEKRVVGGDRYRSVGGD